MLPGSRIRHRRPRALSFLRTIALAAVLVAGPAANPASAREPGGERRDLASLLETQKKLRIAVVGDSVAGDLARGLQKVLHGRANLAVVKFTKPATGLMRDDVYDWPKALAGFLARNKLDVVAVMMGGNDRQSLWLDGKRLTPGTEAWRAEYRRRLAGFMDILAREGAKVYWVGLPPVRSGEMSRDFRALNAIFREEAARRGFAYVDAWRAFADGKGNYTAFGRDEEGTQRRMRKGDGMHFSIHGELRLARTVAQAIGRGLGDTKPSH